jgi:pyruvate dehydrogenase E2 component (dihydrolipoamide acetyltransferase)
MPAALAKVQVSGPGGVSGTHRIAERPWAVQGLLGIRPIVSMTLAADHRASDGHTGARFLARVDRLLQTPEKL